MYQLPKEIQEIIYSYEYNKSRQHMKNVVLPHLKYVMNTGKYFIYSYMFNNINIIYNHLSYNEILTHYYKYIKDTILDAKKDYYKLRYSRIIFDYKCRCAIKYY